MKIKGSSLSQPVRDRMTFVRSLPPENFAVCADMRLTYLELQVNESSECTLNGLHKLQRFYFASKLGLINHPKIVEALLDEKNFPTWKDYTALDVPEEKRNALVNALYEGDPQNRQPILLIAGDNCRTLMEKTLERALEDSAEVDPFFIDMNFHRRLLSVCNEDQAKQYAELRAEYYMNNERRLEYRVNTPTAPYIDPVTPSDINTAHATRFEERVMPRHSSMFYTLTLPPTEEDAKLEGMTLEAYTDLFFSMNTADKKKVDIEHKIMIAKLNAGSMLRFTNDDGTDVSGSIENMTFANSLTAKNLPGFECFSAFVKNSVNGKIVAKGNFQSKLDESQIIKDITLVFKDGQVVDFDAAENREELERYLNADPGNRYTGEIGIGTNPMLRQHVVNGLLVEKIGGSFHVALGHCYRYKEYMGEPVNVDNGNHTGIHWDITTMLFGKNGKIILDNETLFENDKWVDPRLSYLNTMPN